MNHRSFHPLPAVPRGILLLLVALVGACGRGGAETAGVPDRVDRDREFRLRRERMVEVQIRARGVRDERVLEAMGAVPRHRFVPESLVDRAYEDRPLPIGLGQTISQPYIVALMTEALRPRPDGRYLEVGTGSGYQAAVLAGLVAEVYSIEIVEGLYETARRRLPALGYRNVHLRLGDGYRGWPEEAPFDGIIVTAAPGHVPPALVEQLKPGARLVIPVGDRRQELRLIEKTARGTRETTLLPVRFVPMTGEAREGPEKKQGDESVEGNHEEE